MAHESAPQLGREEQQIVNDFVESSAWTVGQRVNHGSKGYHLRVADPHGIQGRAGGEIWTASVEKSFPDGVTLGPHGKSGNAYISGRADYIAPPIDRFGGLPRNTAVMGMKQTRDDGTPYVDKSDWSYKTGSSTDEYRFLSGLLSPNYRGELREVDFGMVPAVVVAAGSLGYKALEGRPYERHYDAYTRRVQGPDEIITEVVKKRIPRKFRKDLIVSEGVQKTVHTTVEEHVPAHTERGVNTEAVLDPGNTPLVIDGVSYVMTRIFFSEDHKIAVTPDRVAYLMADLMDERSFGDSTKASPYHGPVLGALNRALNARHPRITDGHDRGDRGSIYYASNLPDWEDRYSKTSRQK